MSFANITHRFNDFYQNRSAVTFNEAALAFAALPEQQEAGNLPDNRRTSLNVFAARDHSRAGAFFDGGCAMLDPNPELWDVYIYRDQLFEPGDTRMCGLCVHALECALAGHVVHYFLAAEVAA